MSSKVKKNVFQKEASSGLVVKSMKPSSATNGTFHMKLLTECLLLTLSEFVPVTSFRFTLTRYKLDRTTARSEKLYNLYKGKKRYLSNTDIRIEGNFHDWKSRTFFSPISVAHMMMGRWAIFTRHATVSNIILIYINKNINKNTSIRSNSYWRSLNLF